MDETPSVAHQIKSFTNGSNEGEFFEEEEKPLTSESCGRGIVRDAKRVVIPHWKNQMKNLNQKTIGVTFFMFFAAVTPTVTFGAVYADVTNNYMGPVEMLLSSTWCGIVYTLIGGQPIAINGGTGPVLAFGTVLYQLSQNLDVPFLTFNAWVGLWVGFYMFLAAFFDANRILRYVTRFTDDIFALLISSIYIAAAFIALIGYFDYDEDYAADPEYEHTSVAFLSLILALGTCYVASYLRGFKFTSCLCNQQARSSLADFAVALSIILFTVIDCVLFSYVPTQQLNIPDTFAPTFVCCTSSCDTYFPDDCPEQAEPWGRRPWLVNLFELNGKTHLPFMAAGPALLAVILLFLDNGITWHIINHPSHKISYGTAYNYDTVIMGCFTAINSIIGIPWVTASTVPSLSHYHALAEKDLNGNIVGVFETRLTLFLVHVMVGCCLFVLSVFKLIPVPVLYGVFLFMGIAGLSTNQFWHRFLLFFVQPSKYPDSVYVQEMKIKRIHLYTFVEILSFGMLYIVKETPAIAIAFPVMILATIPIRAFLLPRIFTKGELVVLDGADEEIEEYYAKKETTEVIKVPVGSDDKNVIDEELELTEDVLSEDDHSLTAEF